MRITDDAGHRICGERWYGNIDSPTAISASPGARGRDDSKTKIGINDLVSRDVAGDLRCTWSRHRIANDLWAARRDLRCFDAARDCLGRLSLSSPGPIHEIDGAADAVASANPSCLSNASAAISTTTAHSESHLTTGFASPDVSISGRLAAADQSAGRLEGERDRRGNTSIARATPLRLLELHAFKPRPSTSRQYLM